MHPTNGPIGLPGKTVLIFGLGKIGGRLAKLAKAFGMTVIGIKRDTVNPVEYVDELYPPAALGDLLPRADVTVLTCPLTPRTRNVIDAAALAAMRPLSYFTVLGLQKIIEILLALVREIFLSRVHCQTKLIW